MLKQWQWLRSIDINSDSNYFQAASNNQDVDKEKDKWAVNMYKHLTVDILDLHLPIALNADSFSFYIISCKYTYLHIQFFMTMWNNFMMQYELGWIVIECHNCCMNGRNLWIVHIPFSSPILDFPTLFSSLGKSSIILQWLTSMLNLHKFASTIVQSTFETIANEHSLTHNTHPVFKPMTLSSVFMSYISSYNKYIIFSYWSWSLENWMIHWNKIGIHQTEKLNKDII